MEIRRIRVDDSARLRALRLRALSDAPAAFGQTLAETNEPARSLYARQAFVATDQTKPLPSNPVLREVLMVRELT